MVLGDDGDLVGDEKGGVETDAELPDEVVALGLRLKHLHEFRRAGARDGAEEETRSSRVMPMPVSSMTSVLDAGSPLIRIFISPSAAMTSGFATDVNRSLSSASEAFGHELAEEHVSVAVQGVDDEVEEAVDLGLVLVRLAARGLLLGGSLGADDEGVNPRATLGTRGGELRMRERLRRASARARAAREGAAAKAAREVIAAADIVVVADGWIVSSGGSVGREGSRRARARSKDADATKKSGGGDKKAPEVEGRGRSLKIASIRTAPLCGCRSKREIEGGIENRH